MAQHNITSTLVENNKLWDKANNSNRLTCMQHTIYKGTGQKLSMTASSKSTFNSHLPRTRGIPITVYMIIYWKDIIEIAPSTHIFERIYYFANFTAQIIRDVI